MVRLLGGALALLAAAPALAAPLSRQPYLQSVTPASAIVAFRSEATCPATVRYGAGASQGAATSPAGRVHAVRLEGLAPGTTYQYSVEVCGATAVAGKRLRTAPVPGARRVHFAASADFGTGGPEQIAVGEAMEARDPELLLGAGDLAYDSGTEAEFQERLFVPWAGLLDEVPLFGVAGNHEYATDMAAPFLANLHNPTNNPAGSEKYYSFDWGHVHFAGLDSNCVDRVAADCSVPQQQEWLERDLAASRQPFKVVFLHHPPWSSGKHGSSRVIREAFEAILERHGVDLVLVAHDHAYERTKPLRGGEVVPAGTPGAITYVVVGNGGAALRPWPGAQPAWSAYRNAEDHGFLDVRVEEGVLRAEMVTTAGAVADSFRIEKALPPVAAAAQGGPPGDVGSAPGAPFVPASTGPGVTGPAELSGASGGCGTNADTAALSGLLAVAAWTLLRRRRPAPAAVPARPRRRP